MKILKYSSLNLLFATIMQVVSGYTCPNVAVVNSKIAENKTMRFPLAECAIPTRRGYAWIYKDNANQNQKFYNGHDQAEEIVSIYYQKPSFFMTPSLTCFYKDKAHKFFSLVMGTLGASRVNTTAIQMNCKNWKKFHSDGLYVCGDEEKISKNQLEDCPFYLKIR